MKIKASTFPQTVHGLLRLSVSRLMRIREVQASEGGNFVKVARDLGYTRVPASDEERELAEQQAQLSEPEQRRRARSQRLLIRLRAARRRLGLCSLPPASVRAGDEAP